MAYASMRTAWNKYIVLSFVKDEVICTIDQISNGVFDQYYSEADTKDKKILGIHRTIRSLVNNGELILDDDCYHLSPNTVVEEPTNPFEYDKEKSEEDSSPKSTQVQIADTGTVDGVWQRVKLDNVRRDTWISDTGGTLESITVDILDIPNPDDIHQIDFLDAKENVLHSTYVSSGQTIRLVIGRDSNSRTTIKQLVHYIFIYDGEDKKYGWLYHLRTPREVSIILL